MSNFVHTKRGFAMKKERVENLQDAKAAAHKSDDAGERQRSTIQFPYNEDWSFVG